MGKYHEALKKEVSLFLEELSTKEVLETVYIGGGTPSTYPSDLLLDMFDTLRSKFIIDSSTEVTLEVNPGTVKPGQLSFWKDIGINRLSVGVQSLKDDVLRNLNRHQSAKQVFELLQEAESFIDNISIDLILGLPGVSSQEWKDLIAEVVTWPIQHMSVYFLTVHESTPLFFKVKKNAVILPPDDEVVELYWWTHDMLNYHGLVQYEISSFARAGYQSRHNTVYWERKPYKAFGLGACSFDGLARYQNEKSLMAYIDKMHNGVNPVIFCEHLTSDQVRLENIMLGLRRTKGVLLTTILDGITAHKQQEVLDTIKRLSDDCLVKEEGGRVHLTPRGLAVENEIATQLS